jgi:uncharacterized protein involved in exopolysaccharide biosynthesis
LKYSITLTKAISKTATLDSKNLIELAKKLAVFEYSLSEEYSSLVQLQTLKYMSREIYKSYGVDLENVKGVFESIINDEKKHREILVEIIEFLTELEEDDSPKFEYQNPDVWFPTPKR